MGTKIEGDTVTGETIGKSRQGERVRERCRDCYSWVPTKKGYKCVLSGKKRLGDLGACQYLDSRLVGVSVN